MGTIVSTALELSATHSGESVNEGADKLRRVVVIANPHGLHMRPAAAFVETASRFQSQVVIWKRDHSVNGKSFLDLLMLAAETGTELTLEVTGSDAAPALEALCGILESPSCN
jgi:phosphotransferase system HPr (HPr) family protein